MKKRLARLLIILVFIASLAYFLWPIPFDKDYFDAENISITYTINSMENGIIVPSFKNLTYASSSPEFKQMQKLFAKYSYHNCFATLKREASIENNAETFILTFRGKTIVLSNVPNIIIEDKVYCVGYWRAAKINEMIHKLKDIINVK